MRLVMYPSFLRLMGKCKNASAFKIKRKYVLHQTHLCFFQHTFTVVGSLV